MRDYIIIALLYLLNRQTAEGLKQCSWADPEGGQGVRTPPPLKNHKNVGFLSNTGPDPLKSQSYQASIQCWATIGSPAKRHLNGVSLAS